MNPTLDLGPIIAGAVLLAAGLGFLQAAKLANRRITSRLRLILVLPCSVLGFAVMVGASFLILWNGVGPIILALLGAI